MKLVETQELTFKVLETNVDVEIHKATWKEVKALQSVFLRMALAAKSGQDLTIVDGIDQVLSSLAKATINTGEENVKLNLEELPLDVVGQILEAVINLNFTQSLKSALTSVSQKLNDMLESKK